MDNEQWMAADEFCTYYKVEYSFIHSLHESGLIRLTTSEERGFIPADQIQDLEKFVRLHYDLDINIEGIEAIAHLLERINLLQKEILHLKRREIPGHLQDPEK